MYTLDNMLAREKLREHPGILAVVNKVCISTHTYTSVGLAPHTCRPVVCVYSQHWYLVKPEEYLTHAMSARIALDEYKAMFKRIMLVVTPELGKADVEKSIEMDWSRDRAEHGVAFPTLSHHRFFNALFELAGKSHHHHLPCGLPLFGCMICVERLAVLSTQWTCNPIPPSPRHPPMLFLQTFGVRASQHKSTLSSWTRCTTTSV